MWKLTKHTNVSAVAFGACLFHASGLHCEDALHPKEWRKFKLSKITPETHNVSRLRFTLQSPEDQVGLPVASCLLARANIDGKNEIRPYTPVSSNEEKGYVDLVVKGYEQGKVSKHIVNLKVGDELEMKGPFKKYPYKPNTKKVIGMIAGGSGITPMLQVAKEILRNPKDETKVRLLFANVKEEDIILRNELDTLAYFYPDRFEVIYCLDKAPEKWTGYSGYITKEMLQSTMPVPSEENLIMVCGPPPMMFHISGNKAKDKSQGDLNGLLSEMKYTSSMVFKF